MLTFSHSRRRPRSRSRSHGSRTQDGNAGLVAQALARAPRWAIRRLTETYMTLGLAEIARASGGQSFRVDDAGELDQVYERLGSRIGTRSEEREVSVAFAGAGLVVLLAGLGTGLRRRSVLA